MAVLVTHRQALYLVLAFLLILLMVHRNGKRSCEVPESLQENSAKQLQEQLPTIYAVTPTYGRPEQKAELTRLSHIFRLVPQLHWILIEDANTTSRLVGDLLERTSLTRRTTHLCITTSPLFKLKSKDPHWTKPRGVDQRNLALTWLRANVDPTASSHSLVYFMDDDNAYSVELFEEIAKIERGRVGVWPVGLVGGLLVERPILNADNDRVVGFNAAWRPERPFPIDMAAFAVSADLFFKYPQAQFSYEVQRGYQESEILRQLRTEVSQLQPLAKKGRDVLVWHTRTEKTKLSAEDALIKQGKRGSDAGMEI